MQNKPTIRRLSATEIVDETIAYYRTHPRSLIYENAYGPTCFYRGPNGAQCAVARCCPADTPLQEKTTASENIHELGDEMFLPQYRGYDKLFWARLQTLHDADRHWTTLASGDVVLTESGQAYADKIKSLYPA